MKYNKILILSLLLLCGCDRFHPYKGDRYDLLTIVFNCLPGAQGSQFMKPEGPVLEVIEEDEFGRVLFYYYENREISTHSLIISQKSDKNNVYYYDNVNFISNDVNEFSNEEIDELKRINNWNNALEIKKMIKKKIVKEENQPKINEKKVFTTVVNDFVGNENTFNSCDYITSDYYGKHLYMFRYYDLENTINIGLIIFDDKFIANNKSILILEEYYNYQYKLIELKENNNWTYDYCSDLTDI